MYGSLATEEPEPEPVLNQRTPASTLPFVQVNRMVRNFGGARFTRSVQEGKK